MFATFQRVLDTASVNVPVTLHRMLFSDALGKFAGESVDLIHIDGFHSYDAVQGDFVSWLPKLASPSSSSMWRRRRATSGG